MSRSVSVRRPAAYGILLLGCSGPQTESAGNDAPESIGPSRYLYAWARDTDERDEDTDFLAVLDADPSSSR